MSTGLSVGLDLKLVALSALIGTVLFFAVVLGAILLASRTAPATGRALATHAVIAGISALTLIAGRMPFVGCVSLAWAVVLAALATRALSSERTDAEPLEVEE